MSKYRVYGTWKQKILSQLEVSSKVKMEYDMNIAAYLAMELERKIIW